MPKLKILFVHTYPLDQLVPFVRQDLLLLQQMYQVEELALTSLRLPKGPLVSPEVWRAIARNDLVFVWFNSPLAIIAKVLKKPCLLVGGGADVVNLPEIGYGVGLMPSRRRFLAKMGFRLASQVLLFSNSSRQSLQVFIGKRTQNFKTLYLAVDGDVYKPGSNKTSQVLTVGYVNINNLRRKGLQTFAAASCITPDIPYKLGGKVTEQAAIEIIKSVASSNLEYLGYLDDSQLLAEYQRARVYAQLSAHEGFGMALAEAMACECVPVVTAQGSIPEVVGDTGVYVVVEDPIAASEAIERVIKDSNSELLGKRARQRIIDMFPISKRKNELQVIIETVVTR